MVFSSVVRSSQIINCFNLFLMAVLIYSYLAAGTKEMRVVLKCEKVVCCVPKFCKDWVSQTQLKEEKVRTLWAGPYSSPQKIEVRWLFTLCLLYLGVFCLLVLFGFFFLFSVLSYFYVCPFTERQIQPCLVNGTDKWDWGLRSWLLL